MRWRLPIFAALIALGVSFIAVGAARSEAPTQPTFRPLAIYLESDSPISAYQVEVMVVTGEASFIGVEGGEAPLDDPPRYDPRALSDARIVLAAFDTERSLTPGRHQVATLHVRELGAGVQYRVRVTAAADLNAHRVEAQATIESDREVP